MAPTLLRGPRALFLLLVPLRLWLLAPALEMIDQDAPELTCGEGLTDCYVNSASPYSAVLPDPNDVVDVTHMQLKVILCCSARQGCEPCLQIIITVQVAEVDDPKEVSEESGEPTDEEGLFGMNQMGEGSGQIVPPEPTALVKVGLSSPGTNEIWKLLQFTLSLFSLVQPSPQLTHEEIDSGQVMQLLLTEKVKFGSPVVVQVYAHSKGTYNIQNVTIPSLEEVCSMDLEVAVKNCDVPRLRVEIDHKRNVVVLQLENMNVTQDDLMCQMMRNEMPIEILAWPKGKREMIISSNIIAPCLCFQMWWRGKPLRRKFCPFKNQQDALERMQHSVSVSMQEFQMREGGTGLSWNLTAPCRLEAEVWLCKKDLGGGHCEEVTGSRQRLHSHAGWTATRSGHLVKTLGKGCADLVS